MVTAQVHGVKRYLMLSAVNAVEDSNSPIAHYHKAKAFADRHLMETNLDWTIVCPGNLQDDEGNGLVSVSSEIILQGPTTRDNLATTLVSCLELPNTIGKRFSLLEGKTPIEEALSNSLPTILLVSTPGFCQTSICGPSLEILMELLGESTDALNVIHAEVYTNPEKIAEANNFQSLLSPVIKDYGMTFEPSLIVANSKNKVLERLDYMFDKLEMENALSLIS